jgi:pimeloyl-ACP methyl ester carboxylesterase
VLALHGLTSTSQVWNGLAAARPDLRLVAPDLPGRGGSVEVVAAPGLPGHAAVVRDLVDALGLDDLVLVGHSMGAFLAPLVAADLGDRVRRVVLVDGGVAPARSVLLRRPVVRTLFSVQLRLVDRRWPSPQAHLDKVEGRAATARPDLMPALLEWAEHSLGPDGRPRLAPRRLVADAVDALAGSPTLPALAGSTVPVHLVAAARGADDSRAAFLADDAIGLAREAVPRLTWERADANHVTVMFDPRLAAALDGAPPAA